MTPIMKSLADMDLGQDDINYLGPIEGNWQNELLRKKLKKSRDSESIKIVDIIMAHFIKVYF